MRKENNDDDDGDDGRDDRSKQCYVCIEILERYVIPLPATNAALITF